MKAVYSFLAKSLAALLLLAMSYAANAQILYFEDFSGYNGVMPANITIYNLDGNTVANPNLAAYAQWILVATSENPAGDTVAAVTSWLATPGGQPGSANDWLVTPQISGLDATAVLSWTAVSRDPDYLDGYEVYVSTTGNAVANFGTTPIFSTAGESDLVTYRELDLSAYAGQSIYVAFRVNSTDKFVLELDDIMVRNGDLDCSVGTLDAPSEITLCGDDEIVINATGNALPAISTSGYAAILQPTATGGGGIEDTLTLFGLTFPISVDAGLGGILAANNLPNFTGTYTVRIVAYVNDADTDGSACSQSEATYTITFANPQSGTLSTVGGTTVCQDATIVANSSGASIPGGYAQFFVLTQGASLTIVGLNNAASFDLTEINFEQLGVPATGTFTIHSFVAPEDLDLSVVTLGQTTGVDVLGLIDGGLCASLDVPGAAYTVNACSSSTNDPRQVNAMSVTPNPTSGQLTVNVSLSETADLRFDVIDLMGRVVASQFTESVLAGSVEFDLSAQSAGIYFVRMTLGNEVAVRRVVLTK